MALPVVTVASGGLPVVDMTATAPKFATPVTEAANGRGIAVTQVAARGMPVVYAYVGGDVAPSATLNPATASNMTLSNGNLTATHLSSAAPAGVTSIFKNTGKYYFEFSFVSLGTNGSSVCVGFLSSTGSIVEDASVSPNSVAVFFGGASFLYANGVTTGKDFGNRVVNDRWGIAVDFGPPRLCWFRKNGGLWNIDASANPVTGVNGVAFAAGSYSPWIRFPSAVSGEVMTANFGATAYGNAAPSGFGNWPAS
jgi:hypothetical protein